MEVHIEISSRPFHCQLYQRGEERFSLQIGTKNDVAALKFPSSWFKRYHLKCVIYEFLHLCLCLPPLLMDLGKGSTSYYCLMKSLVIVLSKEVFLSFFLFVTCGVFSPYNNNTKPKLSITRRYFKKSLFPIRRYV